MTRTANSTSVLNASGAVKLLILGGGYSGSRLAQAAAALGLSGVISHRRPDEAAPPPGGWRSVAFDSGNGVQPGASDLAGITHVVSTIAPDSDGRDPVVRCLGPLLQKLQPIWMGYLSTTGVYGDSGGAWVDETSPCRPRAGRSQARLACEQAWQSLGLPLQIFRLPAIYGPGRNPFADLRAGRSRLLHRPGQVFCRVHVDDICGAVLHCLALPPQQRAPIVNISDDAPCPASEQLGYAAHLLDCKLPPLQRYADAEAAMSAMARSFWAENRRVRNTLLQEQLGYRLRYPTYREGLRACLAEDGSQSTEAAGSAT
jgi:nucleoside-diphosphate-sugar epimerase